MHYDFKASDYSEGIHPASHLHVGHNRTVRIANRKILNPVSFVMHIIRQHYPEQWKLLLLKPEILAYGRNVSACLDDVPEKYWNDKDRYEMILQ